MKKITLLLAAVVGTITVSTAQVRIAPEVGAGFNTMNYDPSLGTSTSFAIGPRVGGIVELKFSDNLYLQPGIAWAMKGGKLDLLGIDVTTTLHTIDVPVNLMYKLGKEGSGRFFFGLGPNLSYAFSGKVKIGTGSSAEEEDVTFGSDTSDFKAIDFGANVNVGYELPSGFYARAYYQMGFVNNSNDATFTRKNMGFGLAIGYFFGNKANKPSAASAE